MRIREKIFLWSSRILYWEIIGIPFVACFSSAAVDIFIGLSIFTFLVKRFSTAERDMAWRPLDLPFLLLILVSLFSFVNSVNLHSSIQGIFKLLKYGFLILILGREVRDKEHFKRILFSAVFGLFMASLDGIYQLIFGVDLFRHNTYDRVLDIVRLKASFPHTNIFAGYLALFLPVPIALFLYHARNKGRIYFAAVTAVALFCLVLTFSRSGVLGVWLAVLILALSKKDKAVIAILIAGVFIAPFFAPKSVVDWSKKTSSIGELLFNRERFVLYETSFNMIRHHPLLGVGVNTYCLNYQKYKLHDTDKDTVNTAWYAHNSYLQMAGETGLLGLLAFLYLLARLFSGWKRFYRWTDDNFQKVASTGILLGLFAFLIHGLTETNLYYPKIATLFWFQVGLLASLLYPGRREKNGEN